MTTPQRTELTELNSYYINSNAERAYSPKDLSELKSAIVHSNGTKRIILGGGSNIILSKPNYGCDTSFLLMQRMPKTLTWEENICTADNSVRLQTLVQESIDRNFSGLEKLIGIPGTIGGAIYMNAGAFDCDIHQALIEVTTLNLENNLIMTYNKNDLENSYRTSIFQKSREIIIQAKFKFIPGAHDQPVAASAKAILKRRHTTIPYILPNAGSVFQRPNHKLRVGEMIDALGLKGFRIGGAMISELHGGFIVNICQATGSDVIALAQHIKNVVLKEYGTPLHLEQVII
ncbi:UDP-N-acetylmuramate dehydrogenase [Pseudomonas putida]|uniref:UDP-N-acetylmuramate dehydrogenase n=1 Tax=Pseudomonas putida TaxID=303 RepID=UPI0009BDB21F|nr:UDP-N-acetylmuramate dehydrogenase [Pseudomonas putida]